MDTEGLYGRQQLSVLPASPAASHGGTTWWDRSVAVDEVRRGLGTSVVPPVTLDGL